MSRTSKRFLSLLLAVAMILSLGITGWAVDDIAIASETPKAAEKDEHVTEPSEGGTELELQKIEAGAPKLGKLGEIKEEEVEDIELPFGFNDIVRVSIVLDRASTLDAGYATQNIVDNGAAMAYRQSLKNQQAQVEAEIASAGISIDVKWNLTLAVNIISAEVRYGDIEAIEAVPGVLEVWLETRYEPQVAEVNTAVTTEYMVGATAAWADGYTGAGSRVAIIDTGTDYKHQSFDPEAFMYALAEDGGSYPLLDTNEIAAALPELNANNTAAKHQIDSAYYVYKNAKIPFAYNYIDGNNTTDHMSDTQEEHGSHVSGIAAANRYIKIDGQFVDAVSAVGAVGVAPDAQILTMKVFGKGGGAYDSDYMAAIEDAIILKADSVNLSLGSGNPGLSFANGYQDIMDSLVDSGTVVVVASGNAYNWAEYADPYGYLYLDDVSLATNGFPGSYRNSLTVASADNIGSVGMPVYFNDNGHPVFYSETSGYGNDPLATIVGTYDYVLIDGPGVDDNNHVGQDGDAFFALGSEVIQGKIALCYRGTSSFYAKANAAVAQGAAGVIIINNTTGTINMNLSGYQEGYHAPVVSITKAEGDAVKAASTPVTDEGDNVLYYTGKIEVSDKVASGLNIDRSEATISDFSSWGIPGSLELKPEITAPGGGIYSVWGSNVSATTGEVVGGPDQYEPMSGTSMAAPHVTGMAALLGQYIRENDLEKVTGLNRRTLINSLLMSTATPMIVNNQYLSVMQQGAGLGDTYAATQAKSYILMDESATASAADGKVKAELGQDAGRVGQYSFGFTINNFSDVDLAYELYTDMFTQWIAGSDGQNFFMDTLTQAFAPGGDFFVSYSYPSNISGHDVNKDGLTNRDDVQALVEYLAGNVEADTLDLAAGEMDEVEGISSYDAELLLQWLISVTDDYVHVAAGESVPVTVTITLADELKEFIDAYFNHGAYVEGFTYVFPVSYTEEGEALDVVHSIPIIGFYGSWTEASMFDAADVVSTAYGSTKVSYFGAGDTNYMTVNYGDGSTIFFGNPYAIEDEYPADRLAISPNTKIVNFKYNLLRNASATGLVVLDSEYNVLSSMLRATSAFGAYYYVNGAVWRNTSTTTVNVNKTVKELGGVDGEQITLGFFAIPEYYGFNLHPGENINYVTADEVGQLLASGELGKGAYIGGSFTVDSAAPTDVAATLSEDGTKITVSAKDDNYIAYIALSDLNGNNVYAGEVPEAEEKGETVEVSFDISGLDLPNGVAVIVGDYAANEDAYLIVLDPDKPVTKLVHGGYVLTDSLTAGKDYLIVTAGEPGEAYALATGGLDEYTTSEQVLIEETEEGIVILDVSDASVWSAEASTADYVNFFNKADGGALGYSSTNSPYYSWTNAGYADNLRYNNGKLVMGNNRGLLWSDSYMTFVYSRSPGSVYIFEEFFVEAEIDPYAAESVVVSPDSALLILGVEETVELSAKVSPMVLPDKTVTWSSDNEEVATVDENGLVTAVGVGSAIITASSNATPEITASAEITVIASEPMDAVVYGQVAFGEENIVYGPINLNDMSVEDLSGGAMFSSFYGGGRSGDYIYGNDVDDDTHRYNAEDGYAYDAEFSFSIYNQYALKDAACFPGFTIEDYTDVNLDDEDDSNDEPALYEYPYCYSGISNANYWMIMNDDANGTYFDLSSLGEYVAITFAGIDIGEDGLTYYYLLLKEDGTVEIWKMYPDTEDGDAALSANYGTLATITNFNVGDDPTAFSMSYYEDRSAVDNEDGEEPAEDPAWGVFISDSKTGAVYFVNFNECDENDEVKSHFVGRVEGATSLGALSDFYFDTIGELGTLVIQPDEEEPENLEGLVSRLSTAGIEMTGEAIKSVNFVMPAPEAKDDVAIEAENDDIIVVGTLNAARPQINRRIELLKAAELVNPDSYIDDDVVEISLTAPEAEGTYYNGIITVEYDPAAMKFDGLASEANIENWAFGVDEEAGKITFVFVDSVGYEPSAVLASAKFINLVQDNTVIATAVESNENLAFNEVTEIELNTDFELALSCSTDGIKLDWGELKNSEKYEAQIKVGEQWNELKIVEELTALDGNVVMGETYTYRVRGFKNGAWTGFCKEASVVFNPFSDIPSTGKTFEYASWAYNEGIITGTSKTTFSPNDSCSRVQFVMMLWKMNGSPTVEGTLPFEDVTGAKTTKALLWALDQGIINSSKNFNPNGKISREQVIMILWKMAGSPAAEGEFPFEDVPGAKTQKAVLWAYNAGIVKGTSATTFSPKDDCTRIQLVVMLYKFCNVVNVVPSP